MRVLHVFRPTVPSMRAQVVQVVHTCHALAARGHEVTLFANAAADAPEDPTALLAAWGLAPLPTFNLQVSPTRWSPGAGLWFRWKAGQWADGAGRDTIAFVRELKYLGVLGERPRVVYEAHCLEKQRAAEEGEEVGVTEAWERAMLGRAQALVTNSAGTLAALEEAYGEGLPPIRHVVQNATRADRVVSGLRTGPPTVVYAGSARAWKGVGGLVDAMSRLPDVRLELIGDAPAGPLPPNVVAVQTVPYGELPARLTNAHALVLPLEDNSFGRRFTSPLKLWDYLATDIPIVAADLPTVREAAGDLPIYYPPGDADALAAALRQALASGPRARRIRTWEDRAAELEGVFEAALRAPRRRG